jgi:hypothetical protein
MTYLFIARFLARGALLGARRCSSAKRRAAFTSLADSDPGHREARAGRVRQHDKLLRRAASPVPILGGLGTRTVTVMLNIGPPDGHPATEGRRSEPESS